MAIIIGTNAANFLAGLSENDLLEGLDGDDDINGGSGNDLATGGEGNDILDGGQGDDGLVGGDGNDNIDGEENNDLIEGGNGIDTLSGGSGADQISGGSASDIIIGGSGADTLTGGFSADNFQFISPSQGVDTITDFNGDNILVSAAGFGAGLVPGPLPAADYFEAGAGVGSAVVAGNVRFLYNFNNGNLFFDPTGGSSVDRVQLATLTGGPTLAAANIDIIV